MPKTLSQNTNYTVQNTKYNCSKLSPACHCFTLQCIELCIATCFTKCIVTITNCTITKYQLHHNKIPNTPSQNTKYTSTKYQLHCPKYNIQLIETLSMCHCFPLQYIAFHGEEVGEEIQHLTVLIMDTTCCMRYMTYISHIWHVVSDI